MRGFDPTPADQHRGARRKPRMRPARFPSCRCPRSTFAAACSLPRSGTPGFWNADKNNVQPRLGFAYKFNEKTVVRGGIGVYTVPFIICGQLPAGFSQTTTIVPTTTSA